MNGSDDALNRFEARDLLGISEPRFYQLQRTDTNFPKAHLRQRKKHWYRQQLEAYKKSGALENKVIRRQLDEKMARRFISGHYTQTRTQTTTGAQQ